MQVFIPGHLPCSCHHPGWSTLGKGAGRRSERLCLRQSTGWSRHGALCAVFVRRCVSCALVPRWAWCADLSMCMCLSCVSIEVCHTYMCMCLSVPCLYVHIHIMCAMQTCMCVHKRVMLCVVYVWVMLHTLSMNVLCSCVFIVSYI